MAEFRSALEERQDAGSRTVALMEGLVADQLSAEEQQSLIDNERRINPDILVQNFGTQTENGFFDEQPVESRIDTVSKDAAQTAGEITDGEVRPNPLNQYPNYTYNLSLAYLDLTKYNNIVLNGEDFIAADGEVLIASAGRHNDTDMVRNPRFQRDMYFENFKMTTIIGYNSRTRGSNAIDISFTIIEPYSITLMDKILKVARDADIRAWDQMPFVVKIDFMANQEFPDGPLPTPIPELSKRLAIKIIDIKIKLTHRGTEYTVTAIPMSHVAMLQTIGTTPINLEVGARNLKDFFDSNGSSGNVGTPEREQVARDNEDLGVSVNETADKDRQVSQTTSYPAALTAWQRRLVDKQHQGQADEYKFVLDPELANATLIPKGAGGVPFRSIPNPTDGDKPNFDKMITRINAGASIIDVINMAVYGSSFYQDQIKPSNTVDTSPMQAHKILTKIEYVPGEYDEIRKCYRRIITYYIKKVDFYNQKSVHIKRSTPKSVSKEYQYMYTGRNQEILDLQIDFNTMFYVAITALELKDEKSTAHRPNPEARGDEAADDQLAAGNSNKIDPLKVLPVPIQSETATAQRALNRKSTEAQDLQSSMMSSSRGDMLNIKMKIAGDPDLIKQDEVYYPPDTFRGTSIVMDAGEIFANLYFRTPEDIDQDTGLYEFADNNSNVFNGKYKILSVDNSFERGAFTQTIDMIRLFEQEPSNNQRDSNRELSTDAEAQPGGFYGDKPAAKIAQTDESFVQDEYGRGGEIIEVGGEIVAPESAETLRLRYGLEQVQPRAVTDMDF